MRRLVPDRALRLPLLWNEVTGRVGRDLVADYWQEFDRLTLGSGDGEITGILGLGRVE